MKSYSLAKLRDFLIDLCVMQNTEATQRAEAISQLWDLKRLSDQQQGRGMPFVHFNMLLVDPVYRDGVLSKAQYSQEPELRALAEQLRELNIKGRLRRAAPNGSATAAAASIQSGAISLGGGGNGHSPASSRSRAFLWWGGGAVLLMLAAVLMAWQSGLFGATRIVVVEGSIMQDTVWKSGKTYVLSQATFVESNARLTIEPGVLVRGEPGSALIVTRDASLHARGRSDRPIVFTSAQPLGQRQPGDWGGVVLLGNAPVNRDGRIEGVADKDSRGAFGGSDMNDSCGVLDFVRIEFAGFEMSQDNELNGLTLGGCGRGTVVRHVQVHRGLDDGIEVFGGAVDLQRVVVSGAGDDGFDWDMGWVGRVQHLIVQMHADSGDNAFEGDSNKANMSARPRSQPEFYNVTVIDDPEATNKHRVMTLRRGSGIGFHNVLISGFNGELFDFRDEPVAALVASDSIRISGVIAGGGDAARRHAFPSESDDDAGFDEAAFFNPSRLEFVGNTGLSKLAHDALKPGFTPVAIGYAMQTRAVPQGEFWNEGADYFGAIRPGDRRNWSDGWTAYPQN